MHGMFKANGGCGYVKKPDFLINVGSNNEVFDPKAHLPVKTTLKVKTLLLGGLSVVPFEISVVYTLTKLILFFLLFR